jgi:T5SS/PEP-CTERM-associated repeat protein
MKIQKLSLWAMAASWAIVTVPNAASAYSGGNGTSANPYIISTNDIEEGGTGSTIGKMYDIDLEGGYYFAAKSSVDCISAVNYSILDVGLSSANNYFTITGTGTTFSCNSSYIGYSTGSSGQVTVTNSAAWILDDTLNVGSSYGTGVLIVTNKGTVSNTGDCHIAYYSDSTGDVDVTDDGSLLAVSGYSYIGGSGSGSLFVANHAMAALYLAMSTGDDGAIYLANGYLAKYMPSQLTISAILSGYNVYIYNGTEYVAATTSNLTSTYYSTSSKYKASDLYDTYGSRIDLTGYTVITGGVNYFDWADSQAYSDGWYDSSWYGWFYNATSYGDWIWHPTHGWQYVYDEGDQTIIAWDCATGTWWYTSDDAYPCMYNYTTGAWYYYTSGTVGSRKFWDYKDKKFVYESTEF